MDNHCIHRDRLMFEMENDDKSHLGEALHWWKKYGKPAPEVQGLKLATQNGKVVLNDPA